LTQCKQLDTKSHVMASPGRRLVKVADETWIVTALLHVEHPERDAFTVEEIVARAAREAMAEPLRPGVYVHALQHCVANRSPNPARYRMLFATGSTTRRLFRPGDPYHPGRDGAKTVPARQEIPHEYHRLLDWYEAEYARRPADPARVDPILALRGLGKEIWADEDPDDYVRRLREGWG
jgi:hypothetical protein